MALTTESAASRFNRDYSQMGGDIEYNYTTEQWVETAGSRKSRQWDQRGGDYFYDYATDTWTLDADGRKSREYVNDATGTNAEGAAATDKWIPDYDG